MQLAASNSDRTLPKTDSARSLEEKVPHKENVQPIRTIESRIAGIRRAMEPPARLSPNSASLTLNQTAQESHLNQSITPTDKPVKPTASLTPSTQNPEELFRLKPRFHTQDQKPLRFMFLGSVCRDHFRAHNLASITGTKDDVADKYEQIGGAASNMGKASKALGRIFNIPTHVSLCARLGKPKSLSDDPVSKHLREIDRFVDLAHPADFFQDNIVITYGGERFISRDRTVPMRTTLSSEDLLQRLFEEPHLELSTNGTETKEQSKPNNEEAFLYSTLAIEEMKSCIHQSDIAILSSRYPDISLAAAIAAKKDGIPIVFDYSITNATAFEGYEQLFELSDFVFCASESAVPGMSGNDNPDELEKTLLSNYNIKNLAISGGSDPIRMHFTNDSGQMEAKTINLPKLSKEQIKDASGTGDLRNAAFSLFYLAGDRPERALQKASEIATYSIQFKGREWVRSLASWACKNPLFNNNDLVFYDIYYTKAQFEDMMHEEKHS